MWNNVVWCKKREVFDGNTTFSHIALTGIFKEIIAFSHILSHRTRVTITPIWPNIKKRGGESRVPHSGKVCQNNKLPVSVFLKKFLELATLIHMREKVTSNKNWYEILFISRFTLDGLVGECELLWFHWIKEVCWWKKHRFSPQTFRRPFLMKELHLATFCHIEHQIPFLPYDPVLRKEGYIVGSLFCFIWSKQQDGCSSASCKSASI